MGKKDQHEHPINAYPFEGFYDGGWRNVEYMRIKDGTITACFEHLGIEIEDEVRIATLRMKSRKANVSDCTFFLRPGVDVCVLSSHSSETDACEESLQPVWINAKISSIERKPHEFRCICRFYVNFIGSYYSHGNANKDLQEVQLENISILQRLDKKPCEDEFYRWSSSKDCFSVHESKLRGRFSSDVSWLLVVSCLKGAEFEVRSMQNKIVYQVVGGDDDMFCCGSDEIVKAINFKSDECGVMRPNFINFVPEVSTETGVPDDAIEVDSPIDLLDDEFGLSPYDQTYLRRSKRRNMQPDRFVGDGFIKTWKGKRSKEVETSTIILCDTDSEGSDHALEHQNAEISSQTQLRKVKMANGKMHRILIVENQKKGKTTTCKRLVSDGVSFELAQHSHHFSGQISKRFKTSASNGIPVTPLPNTMGTTLFLNDHPHDELLANSTEKVGMTSSRYVITGSTETGMRKNNASGRRKRTEVEKTLKGVGSSKEFTRRKLFFTRRKVHYEGGTRMKKVLSKSEYKEIIERYMKNIDSEIQKPQVTALSQWVSMPSKQRRLLSYTQPTKQEEEKSELDDLWKQMETTMSSFQFLEESQNDEVANEVEQQPCQHDFRLDEEIGEICRLCKYIREIRYILPPFLQSSGMIRDRQQYDRRTYGDDWEFDLPASSRKKAIQVERDSVRSLIPDLWNKLHNHQKNAFEFLWRNIAGSLMPADMHETTERTGGCVISHSPGAGKTFLMIAFITSYLKLFPGERLLVLSPKTAQYTWYKEFKKWDVTIPVYQIHGRKNYKKESRNRSMRESPGDLKPNRDMWHVIDCLEKLQKWLEGPSVLLMSYPAFLSVVTRNSQYEHWSYMAKVLQRCPGLLILDEGHNPRSTRSMLRKNLMKVKTDQRILLSGTLFQNNFEEYFNTLCLARPLFMSEVLRELAPKKYRKRSRRKMTRKCREKLARKIFMDEIAQRIYSKVEEERKLGLKKLKKLTNDFIDVYEGGTSDILPGLQTFKLLMKPTVIQQEFLAKLQKFDSYKRYPLELELLVTFISIHPWLVKSLAYSDKYFSVDELEEIERHKLDVKVGNKVRFVVNLVHQCIIRKEKVLIFCRNIAPIKLFVEIFEKIFGWSKGEEVLVLHGEQELYERGKVIDTFEEPSGSSQVLLASIAACSEGISLTAASRVVLLDSEWNPSKTKQAVARAFRPGQERVVYVYQLLASGTMEEDKYGRNTWKEKVSRMIFVGSGTEDSSCKQPEVIDDEVLREIVEEDQSNSFHMITKDEKLSDGPNEGKVEGALFSL